MFDAEKIKQTTLSKKLFLMTKNCVSVRVFSVFAIFNKFARINIRELMMCALKT